MWCVVNDRDYYFNELVLNMMACYFNKMTMLSNLVLAISLFLSSATWANSDEFVLETFDGETTFGGQIDFPKNCYRSQYKTAILVAGTGLYYRNAYLGLSGTERDYVFKDLAKRLNQKCIAVVRYDYRGVKCDIDEKGKVDTCLDQKVRRSVDAQTIIDDIQAVYDHALSHKKVDSSEIVFLGHSEGSLNISRLWDRGTIKPKGLVFIGGMTESPKSLIRWQFIDRSVDQAFAMDTDGNGILTNWEVTLGYPGSFFEENDIPILNLLSPTGMWNRWGLHQFYALEYSTVVNATMLSPGYLPYIQKGITYSSLAWWKKWFTDSEPVVEKLIDFEGPITYFNGSNDIQAPGEKQQEFLKNYAHRMTSPPEFNLIEGKGHLLSNHPLYGPIDEDLVNRVINSIVKSFN